MGYAILFLFLLFFNALQGQVSTEITVERERVFQGTALYGFMNGGSDLYLEYGFEKLTTSDVVFMDEKYTVDVYEMSSPENAFGIYSLHTFKCMRADTLDFFNCLSNYQLQAVVDKKYISIVFPSGSSKARINANLLLKQYAGGDYGVNIDIPSKAKIGFPYSSKLKLLKGPLSVSNAQPALQKWLAGISYTSIWLIEDRKGVHRAVIFPSDISDLTRLQDKIPDEYIVDVYEDYIHAKCPQQEDREDYGSFGF